MNKTKVGFNKLVDVIGKTFFEKHKDYAVFSYGDTEQGLYCFLGIDMHPETRQTTLSANIEEWDVYATCYVTDNDVIIDKCKLP